MLTDRQQKILHFIQSFQRLNQATPSNAEIQAQFSLRSPASVTEYLNALEKKGFIRRNLGQARNIRVLGPTAEVRTIDVPVFGSIPAGIAEITIQEAGRSIAFDSALIRFSPHARLFGLEVRGDSMVGAGILDGDIVILEQGPDPNDGDIVAALIDGATTLKRYRIKNHQPILEAENLAYAEQVPQEELIIQGIYRGLIRIA